VIKCRESLERALETLFENEKETILDTMAWALAQLLEGKEVRTHELQALPEGMDALLLMDEWRLLQPVGASLTKAWEDVSQLLSVRDNLKLTLPAWVKTLARLACETKSFSFRKAILTIFSDEGHPAWLKMPAFLFEMALASDYGIIDSAQINRLLREMQLGIPSDTLIAQLKNYGFISPHLRADFFRMQSPHYEIHPLIVYASTHEANRREVRAE